MDIDQVLRESPRYILTKMHGVAKDTHGYDQVFIVGSQGSGKTTYCLHSMFQIMNFDWDMVLKYTKFNPIAFLNDDYRPALRERRMLPLVLFDDSSLHFSKYMHLLGKDSMKFMVKINFIFNTMRLVIPLVMFTSPDDDIYIELRKKSWIYGVPQIAIETPKGDVNIEDDPEDEGIISVDSIGNYDPEFKRSKLRIIKIFKKDVLHWDIAKHKIKTVGTNRYYLALPPDIRKQYEEIRSEETDKALESLEVDDTAKDKLKDKVSVAIKKYLLHWKVVIQITENDASYRKVGLTYNINASTVLDIVNRHNHHVRKDNECPICSCFDEPFKDKMIDTVG